VIIDERTYTCLPGKLPDFMNVYTNVGRPIQWPILGSPLGIFVTDVGILNQVVLWWRFDSMADRELRRAELAAAPGWGQYMATALPFLAQQENRILVPTALSPMKS
jgi:hypothetical protein